MKSITVFSKIIASCPCPSVATVPVLRDRVLQRTIPTAVTDAGASSNCGAAPLVSACGDYEMRDSSFRPTWRDSDRIFRDASGGLSPATELRELPMDLRPPANLSHMVPGLGGNLFSTSKFVDAGYAWIFDQDEVSVYAMTNTKITISQAAIMKGWRVPEEGMWRFSLLPPANTPMFDSRRSPQELHEVSPPSKMATTRRGQAWTGQWRRNTFLKQRRYGEGTDATLSQASAQQRSRS